MFFQLKTFRMSSNAVTSSRPSFRPLLIRRSRYLVHGVVEELTSPACVAVRPKFVPGAVWPPPAFSIGVYGRPDSTRNVAKALTLLKMLPTVVPCCQPCGTVNDTDPTRLCVRCSYTARACSAGGSTEPVPPEIDRALVLRYEYGDDPVPFATSYV